jgi:hypothetical protein
MPDSDARIGGPFLLLWKFGAGKLIRLEALGGGTAFPEALRAAGLSE